MEEKKLDPWLYWITEHNIVDKRNRVAMPSFHDRLCELAVSSYQLDKKTRIAEKKDMVQFFVKWWFDNKKHMIQYDTYNKVGKLLQVDHATVLHHAKKRKPTFMYEDNTKCIKDFLKDELG